MISPAKFIQQVRSEAGKITWPGRREVLLTTVMVLLLTTLAAIFFTFVDMGIRAGLQAILTFFGS